MIGNTDQFAEIPAFKIKGRDGYPSIIGTLTSLVIFGTVIAYGVNKYDIMMKYEDTQYSKLEI